MFMKTVYKYTIDIGSTIINCFKNARVLSAGIDPQGNFCVWVLVDPTAAPADLKIMTIGTGWEVPENGRFVQTVKDRNIYMWHIFQIEE